MFSCWDKESVTILKQSFGSSAKQSVRLSKYSWVDAWKNNEIQYLQQLKRKTSKKVDKSCG